MEEPETILNPDPPNRKKIFIPIIIILGLIIGVLTTIKASVHKDLNTTFQAIEIAEGNTLPDFELTKLDGTKTRVSAINGKVFMINFWATWCEACMEEMPSIVTLREHYSAKEFEVLGINVDENQTEVVPAVARKVGIKFPLFSDPENRLAEMFDVHAIPLTVILNKTRKILLVEPGGRDWNADEMHQLIDKWLLDN